MRTEMGNLHRDSAFMMISSFIDIDFRSTGRTMGTSFEFSLSSLCLYRLLCTGLPTVGGSGRLNVLATPSTILVWNGEQISGTDFNTSGVFGSLDRLVLCSVMLKHLLNTGVLLTELFVDLMLPLMMELNEVGRCALSSSDSISSKSMQSSSIDSIESDDRLLNDRKQLTDFGDAFCDDFGGDGFGGSEVGGINVNILRLLLLNPESIEL